MAILSKTNESIYEIPKPSRIPIFLSAFICPGAGQIMQRRWVPALVFGTSFIACFVVFIVCAVKIILSAYAIGFEFNTYEETETPKFMALISFFVAILIYVVSLVDTYRAYGRECASWARRKLRLP